MQLERNLHAVLGKYLVIFLSGNRPFVLVFGQLKKVKKSNSIKSLTVKARDQAGGGRKR